MDLPPDELLDYLTTNVEQEFVEFKHNYEDPHMIADLISALSNGAVLIGRHEAFLIYGVKDQTHEIVGTAFAPNQKKVGGVPFRVWLATKLKHNGELRFVEFDRGDKRIVIIIIPRAQLTPVRSNNIAWIRVGESKKKLADHPEIERRLWELLVQVAFEDGNASNLLDADAVFELLDFSTYYSRQELAIPSADTMLETMLNKGVIVKKFGKYFITNMGAILFGKELHDSRFSSDLANKAPRMVQYKGANKTAVTKSYDGHRGYAVGIERMIDSVMSILPAEEYLAPDGGRRMRTFITRDAIRELTVNMLIHQDFGMSGYAPRVEIYSDRVEFSNSGEPLISRERFIDYNRSRNPKLASLARELKMCEERGMGIDIVETVCEQLHLPSIDVRANDDFTKVTVFTHKTLRQYSSADRVNVVYMHSCLQSINHEVLTNQSLRQRFPGDSMSTIVASRWINEALDAGVLKPVDPSSKSRKFARYEPFWAA